MNINQQPQSAPVRVTDVDMKFTSMIWFMIKWAIASIPALIILSVLVGTIMTVLMIFLAAVGAAAGSGHH